MLPERQVTDQEREEYLRRESYPVQSDAQLGKEILSVDEDYRIFEYYVPEWEKGTLAVAIRDKYGNVKTTRDGEPIYELREMDYIKNVREKLGKLPLKFITGDLPKSNLDLADIRLLFKIGLLEEALVKAMFVEPNRDYTYSLVALGKIKNDLIALKRAYEGFAVHASKATVRYNFDRFQEEPGKYYVPESKDKKLERKLQEPQQQPVQNPPWQNRLREAYFGRV